MKIFLIGFVFLWINTVIFAQSVEKVNNYIYLNFINPKKIDKNFKYPNGIVITSDSPEIYIYKNASNEYIKLPQNSAILKKAITEEYVVMKHDLNMFDYYDFVLRKGDRITVDYQNKVPAVTAVNKSSLTYDYNFEDYFQRIFVKNKYSALIKYFNPKFFMDFDAKLSTSNPTPAQRQELLLKKISKVRHASYQEAVSLLQLKNNLLDSLKHQHLISEVPYHFYKDKIANLTSILHIETNVLSVEQLKELLAKQTANPYGYPDVYHRQLVEAVADKYITEKAPFLDIKDGVNRDYRQVYTRLRASSLFPEKDKNYLLTREITRIGETFSRTDFLAYFKQFAQDVKDTALVNSIRTQYALEFNESRQATKSVVLTDLKNNKLTFDDLLKRHKGKTIYVDFWASWCGPCREALPQSTKLRTALQGKNVVFVYLSIDKTRKPWQTASSQEKLSAYQESYLVVNYATSEFMKQHQVTAIPRYMIFDRNGKMAYANAPKVESKELPPLLLRMAN